ncbi:hypothetical protein Pcinc_016138 [Petrolisthes cinctipes]|uniref:Midasin n=1 Tax=Petrolisthes cinctipes TaxID=88211 RepID=A0AAE1KPS9_PETCI|nr:hypothetical protein Pcinc_016138 [Petrolisthes cinctipes]
MAENIHAFREALSQLSKGNTTCEGLFEPHLQIKKWKDKDWELVLRTAGQALLNPEITVIVGVNLCPWLLELLGRAEAAAKKTQRIGGGIDLHHALSVALSKLVTFSSDAVRFCLKYFQDAVSPFEREEACGEPAAKKMKKQDIEVSEKELLQAGLDLLLHVPALTEVWKCSQVLQYLHHSCEEIKWLACQCIVILSRMNESQQESFILKHVMQETHTRLTVKNGMTREYDLPDIWTQADSLSSLKMSRHTVDVNGISLPVYDKNLQDKNGCLVTLGSTRRNLEAVGRAVCQGHPVLIEGAVGSGKTSIVEHVARLTGRLKAPVLTKVQLGDQTDSKTLLGTYTCTPTPGEFVWHPGSLTQAVSKGYWLLLEDLDYAPMDVISILVPLLESRTLPLPGHGNIRAHPNFQLFATRRTWAGTKLASGSAGLLEKLWTKVTLENLTRSELLKLVTERWPQLQTVSDKMVTVYLMVSSGQHIDDGVEGQEEVVDMTTVKTSGRLVSTRDLMKWCSRVASPLDDPEMTLAGRAFLDALDCFCAAIPNDKTFFKFALEIGSYMNRTKAEVEYLTTIYKPEVKHLSEKLVIGKRAKLPKKPSSNLLYHQKRTVTFSFTRPASNLLERIGVAIINKEPVLIVGETGTGKTSTVQYLAHQTRHKLRVINMNQQSDSADLLGGFKPVEMKTVVAPLRQEFEDAFCATFSSAKNNNFLNHIMTCFKKQRWNDLFSLMEHTLKKAVEKLDEHKNDVESKFLIGKWKKMRLKIASLKEQVHETQSALAFAYIEGALIKAIQEGEWVLLDEINLATAETLECLSGLLESDSGSLTLLERGDNKPISRHEDFRLFACMNPSTDIGKKELPAGLRNRFTEFFMEELHNSQDMMILVKDYLAKLGPSAVQVDGIRKFYKRVKTAADEQLNDGTGHKPHYSLRTLCRALAVAATNPCSNLPRSLYEAFCLSFLTQLNRASHPAVEALVKKHVLCAKAETNTEGKLEIKLKLNPIPPPAKGNHVQIEGYWVPKGDLEPCTPDNYILTETVRQNLHDLVRVVSIGRFPVLLQGDTSVGKTSLVTYLARLTGSPCVRINNHEHTDLQEYIGCYSPDENGKLVFREGALVKAMRNGHWIILDELNLAPSDVLEALNRLLDDNRELFIPETQETVRAHRNFMLFATQNPPGLYGGRKVLSRAFRNRFVELHFTEIPAEELEVILHHRCEVPLSYSKKMVGVLQDLQNMRRGTNIFQGKQSFITLRDLFRWAERYRLAPQQEAKFYDWDQHLADEGYLVLAARVREHGETDAIRKVLEKKLKKKVEPEKLFNLSEDTSPVTRSCLEQMTTVSGFEHIVWTQDMRRLFVVVSKALNFMEPVLLIGETGCGKTTVCQLIAAQNDQSLYTVNCHMHTEGADFLGGLRPVRSHEEESDRLFEWMDGPLIHSMQDGGMFLADEISLADDSVLERLNSVLEPERTLVLAEKGTDTGGDTSCPEIINAHDLFRLVGTMNPSGDFGKKELSPALRNRFTEIWCPKVEINRSASDVIAIIEHNVSKELHLNQEDNTSGIGTAMLEFLRHFVNTDLGKKCVISIRDMLSWVQFINKVALPPTSLDVGLAYIHGACLVLLDGLGSGLTGSGLVGWKQLKKASLNFLIQQVWQKTGVCPSRTTLQEKFVEDLQVVNTDSMFGVGPFLITKGKDHGNESHMFTFKAPRTCINLLRLLRGLQQKRPLLLEGSPGVGKTSLVMALAKGSGHSIVRINLSEQTDVSDLFGADLPVEGGKGGTFAWRDGPLLQALRNGSWIVLDELNLASQTVLEGLNACFDHRGEVYIPELGKTFHIEHQSTKIFACQNPQHQGGARKGLPKSFLNRFTQVHVEALSSADMEFILGMMCSDVPNDILSKMVKFNRAMTSEILEQGLWGQRGGPWELNLRDLFRWCEIMLKHQRQGRYNPGEYVGMIYSDRMRTTEDKKRVFDLYERVFEDSYPSYQSIGRFQITKTAIHVGQAVVTKKVDGDYREMERHGDLYLVSHQLPVLESLINCVNMNWMSLLVGDSSVGKTCVVKLLAQLTGHKLLTLTVNSDMDVTELLGGFQQVDYGRDLGEVVNEAMEVILLAVRKCLLAGNLSQTEEILQAWDQLLVTRNDKTRKTKGEEVKHFLCQCDLLLAVLSLLQPPTSTIAPHTPHTQKKKGKGKPLMNGTVEEIVDQKKVKELNKSVEKLREEVIKAGAVSGGGTFLWVDSILVKAVRDGAWLLIDGVNICAASVLDRLNALLEPGGVLTLSERGVVDGSIPNVIPHKDFRLFLTMNPQHGEISRAMRNRGLEIYMMEGWTRPQDIRAVLLQSGLTQPPIQNAIVTAHTTVASCLPAYEQPSLCQMKQVAELTSQMMQTGHCRSAALKKALELVYIRSQGKPALKRAVCRAIDDVACNWNLTSDMPWPQYENQYLSMKKLILGSNLAEVCVTGSLLSTVILAATTPKAVAVWESATLPLPHSLPTTDTGFLQCLIMILSTTSWKNWPMLEAWITQEVNTLSSDAALLKEKAVLAIQNAISNGQCHASKLLGSKLDETHYYDPRYNLSAQKIKKEDFDIESLANKSCLQLWYMINSWYKQQCDPDDHSKNTTKLDDMTLLEISQAVNKGLVGNTSSPHPVVPLLVPFLINITKLICALANSTQITVTDQEYCELLTALRWCEYLRQLCRQVVSRPNFHLFLPQLTLHWQWVHEEFLQKIPMSWNSCVPGELKELVNRMQTALEKEYGPLHKLATGVRSSLSPAPFMSSFSADAQVRLLSIIANLVPTPNNETVNKFLASPIGKEVCESLSDVARIIATCDSNNVQYIHSQMNILEDTIKQEFVSEEECHDPTRVDTFPLKVEVWPLIDYLGILAISRKKASLESLAQQQDYVEAPGIFRETVTALAGPSYRCSSVLATHSYLALCQSTASHNTRTFLTYSQPDSEEEQQEDSTFLHPATCQLSYIMLAGRKSMSTGMDAIEEIQTGAHVEKVTQLRQIRSTLWNNWVNLADPAASYEASFTRYITMYATSTMGCLATTLDIVPEFNIEVYDLQYASCLATKIAEDATLCVPEKNKLHELANLTKELDNCAHEWNVKSAIASEIGVIAGVIQATILGQLEPVDPAQRIKLLLQYYKQELQDLESHFMFSQWFEHLRGIAVISDSYENHPHSVCFKNRCSNLNTTVSQLSQQVAHRPAESKYQQLKQDLKHFLSTVFVPEKIWALSASLKPDQNDTVQDIYLMETKVFLASCDNFVKRVIHQFPLYRDLTYPFLQAVTITCESFRLSVAHAYINNQSVQCDVKLTDYLGLYAAFPAPREPSQPLQLLGQQLKMDKLTKVLLPNDQHPGQAKMANNHILQAALLDFLSISKAQYHLDKSAVQMVSQLLDEVASQWRQQEEEKTLREQEKESLYKYKSRTLAESQTEDEIQEAEFLQAFPSFDKEFKDLDGMTLDDSEPPKCNGHVDDDDNSSLGYITDQQLYEVSEFHHIVFTNLVKTAWHCAPASKVVQSPSHLVAAALLRLQVLQSIVGRTGGTIAGSSLDQTVIGTFILANSSTCSLLTNPPPPSLISHPYDIYNDPNPQEAIKVRPLLHAVKKHVDKLLRKWPDHPSLTIVNTVIARVFAFPLTSPLMRFVIGLETVLEKAQYWERNAHSGVSMKAELEAVTHQVLEWRQMELSAWKCCLNTVTHKIDTEGRKWWPHLHNTFQAAISKQVSLSELTKALKQFIETSSLGEFQMRLQLLYSFHCNIAALEKSRVSYQVLALAWNLYQYYNQFTPLIATTLSKAREPIEKDVKGFVKIARWNDINYFAVRESVAKSHRILHRHMRKWEKKLREPVSPLLRDALTELSQDHTGAWDKRQDEVAWSCPTPCMPPSPSVVEFSSSAKGTKDKSVLSRLPFLTRRCHKLAWEMLSKLPYQEFVEAVEETTSDIITSYQDIQAAAGRAEAVAKDDRMKHLRHVMQRRRDAVTRLMRTLRSLGILYTRGNSQWRDEDIDVCLSLPPIELDVAHTGRQPLQSACQSWPGCVKYLNRCISRLALLLTSLQQPHKDLGPEFIKQLRGVSCHLFLLVRDQRILLSKVSDNTRHLHNLLDDLRDYEPQAPPLAGMVSGLQTLHGLASSLSLTIGETLVLLGSKPNTPSLVTIENQGTLEQESLYELKQVLEEAKLEACHQAQILANSIRHFEDGERLVTPSSLKLYKESLHELVGMSEKLKMLMLPLSLPNGGQHPLLIQLGNWIRDWDAAQYDLEAVINTTLDRSNELAVNGSLEIDSLNSLECCLTRVLFSVEKLYKRFNARKPKKQNYDDDDDDEHDDVEYTKDLLSCGLVQSLVSDVRDLRMREVVATLHNIVKESDCHPDIINKLKLSLPLLEQYQTLCETVMLFIVSSNRSTAKLSSVILAVFQQLAVKGFCRPKELEEEKAGEKDATGFEDSEASGLGEGTGKKDISERFESEDQLESALQEGQTEKSADDDVEEDNVGVEMSEDFEGKQQDVERTERDENESGDDEDEDEDHEKQMGETEKGADKLDEKIWGEDEDDEDENGNDENKEEEDGPGDGEMTESKMVAKDDNKNKREQDKKQKEKLEEMEDTRKENKMKEDDPDEYNDNFVDPYGGEGQQENEDDEEEMQLPEEMNLDGHDSDDGGDEEEGMDNPMEIAEKGVFPEEEREPKEDNEKDKDDEGQDEQSPDKDGEQNEDDKCKEGVNEEEQEDGGEEMKKDEKAVGTEEKNDEDKREEDANEDTAEASRDKDTKTEAEEAEMDTTEGSKDQTKEQPKTETGGQREVDKEEEQEVQGQMGEKTDDQSKVGQSESRTRDDAHKGESSALMTEVTAGDQNDMKKPRMPGETDENRTLGDIDKEIQQGLMTKKQQQFSKPDQQPSTTEEEAGEEGLDKNQEYTHMINKAEDHLDAQMIDAGTQEQAKEAPAPADTQHPDPEEEDEKMLETPMEVDEEEETGDVEKKEAESQEGKGPEQNERMQGQRDPEAEGENLVETEGEVVMEYLVQRPPETYFHTLLLSDGENEEKAEFDEDIEKTRREIEVASHQNVDDGGKWAEEEARVAPIALHLCEQLRLILEPTQAARLRGDYRTGKRLNMRKVIPYIASQFRKDKIWLRRTQPSKRTYQILVAVDDSESMSEARAGSLALESVVLVTRALTLLEVGQMGVISFGSTTKILHPIDQPFSEAAGSQVIANLKFDKRTTNFSRMLEDSVALLNSSKVNSSHGNPDTAQLLLILSDGQTQTRSEAVKAAVRAARVSRIFIVFMVLDAKDNDYSFYDVLVYEEGRMRPLVESFPFPFFLVVRDIDTLPDALATALRQWFELVTADSSR